jgi:hypothetical protein
MDHKIKQFRNMQKVRAMVQCAANQCEDGSWDWDAYMHGMANGMIFMLSVIFGEEPHYKDAPHKWRCDDEEVEKIVDLDEYLRLKIEESDKGEKDE